MKLLCLCSALDLKFRYGCTPAWWQFFKGLHELGHDVIAVPYQGAAIESPWWRVYRNPCQWEGAGFAAAKRLFARKATSLSAGGGASRKLVETWIRPRWEKHIASILEAERDVAAVIIFTIPVNHLTGVPQRLRGRFNVPFFYYDGDVPASLPRFSGYASGFRIYEEADLSEYDGVLCNSEGGADDLVQMGAKRVEVVHWGVDPDLYTPLEIEQDRDVFCYGFGAEYRAPWLEAMVVEPSRILEDCRFAVGGRRFKADLGRAECVGDVPFNAFRQACCRSRINLNITRQAHASVFASSSMRPFELAAMGCCVVSNPYNGIETWFDLERDVLVVNSVGEAVAAYRRLLGDEAARRAMGESARQRVLDCHTHRHRAAQIAQFVA
ncbi:MAG TPA: glycosyltransferase [Candidatus Hydrogenedentes bacterium]|nr:glycosyltransferase [Candidatus Hydrogenedentota bacterium]